MQDWNSSSSWLIGIFSFRYWTGTGQLKTSSSSYHQYDNHHHQRPPLFQMKCSWDQRRTNVFWNYWETLVLQKPFTFHGENILVNRFHFRKIHSSCCHIFPLTDGKHIWYFVSDYQNFHFPNFIFSRPTFWIVSRNVELLLVLKEHEYCSARPHNLGSFLAANSTKNHFLIARMISFLWHSRQPCRI